RAGEEALAVGARELAHVEMQVAIADVAVGDEAPVGNVGADPGRGARHEVRERGDRQRDVVLETGAFVTLRLGNALAQLPERRSPSSVTAARTSGSAASAVARTCGCGNSLKLAAVITPRVPSAPRNSDLMS